MLRYTHIWCLVSKCYVIHTFGVLSPLQKATAIAYCTVSQAAQQLCMGCRVTVHFPAGADNFVPTPDISAELIC